MMVTMILGMLLAYLLGSISSAIIVCKLFHLPDPRETGSNNPGATNVLRIGGKSKALLVLLVDLLKGVIPVLVARYYDLSPFWISTMGALAVVGHMFPAYYKGKGGKGVATVLGVYLGLSPTVGLLCLVSWFIVFKCFRYSSLASLVTTILAPIYVVLRVPGQWAWFPVLCIGALIIAKHHENIRRLVKGEESKFSKAI